MHISIAQTYLFHPPSCSRSTGKHNPTPGSGGVVEAHDLIKDIGRHQRRIDVSESTRTLCAKYH